MTHNNNNGVSGHKVFFFVNAVIDYSVLNGNDNLFFDLCAELLCNDGGGFIVKSFVDRCHLTERKQLFDNLGGSHFEHCRKLADRDFLGQLEVHLGLLCSLGGYSLEPLRLGFTP